MMNQNFEVDAGKSCGGIVDAIVVIITGLLIFERETDAFRRLLHHIGQTKLASLFWFPC